MMTTDFLKTQLRLLIAQFGRKAVLDALAGLTNVTPDQLQNEIAKLETARSVKSSKREKSLDELLAALPSTGGKAKELVAQLGRMFEAKRFLPNPRDAEEFLRRKSAPGRKYKSRKEVMGAILKSLSEMPESELESLVAHSNDSGGKSDYAVLANQLMGKRT
jgi:hypothetical protein